MWAGRIARGVGAGLVLALASLSPVQADAPRDGATVTRSTGQSIPASTETLVTWTTEALDEAGYWDSGVPTRFDVPRDAWCSATLSGKWAATNATSRGVWIRLNGAEVLARVSWGLSNHNDPGQTVTATWKAAATDYVEAVVWSFGSGGTWGVPTSYPARFSIVCDLDVAGGGGDTPCQTPEPSGGECVVEVTEFTGAAADTLNLGIFSVVVVGGFVLLMLAWIAVQGLRR